jgi:hypothetical protein
MDGFLEPNQDDKKGINKALVIGALVGIVLIGAGIWALTAAAIDG